MPRLKGANGSRETKNVGASHVSSPEVKIKLPAPFDRRLSASMFTAVPSPSANQRSVCCLFPHFPLRRHRSVLLRFLRPQLCVFIGALVFSLRFLHAARGDCSRNCRSSAGSHEPEEGKAQTMSVSHLEVCSRVCGTRNSCASENERCVCGGAGVNGGGRRDSFLSAALDGHK